MPMPSADKLREIIHEKTGTSQPVVAGGSSKSTPPWPLFVAIAILIAVTLACFGRTVTSYFLADDFGEIAYVSRIAGGRWDLVLANWTGNYMQIPGMAVYRPIFLMIILADYLLWHGHAFGYYLTNIIYYTACVLLLFATCRQFTREWSYWRSLAASTCAALFFAVNPLHCESVSWMVGRVDICCCFFYLASLVGFCQYRRISGLSLAGTMVASKRKWWLAGSVACFWLAMLIKEMAIGLPIMVTAISFLSVENEASDQSNFRQRAIAAIRQSAPFWISTAVYFVVRYLALGTLTGGYTGSIGDGQAGSALHRWLDPETYERVLFPFGISLFARSNAYASMLACCYTMVGTLVLIKAFARQLSWRLTALVFVWLGTAALPIYKLWGIGMDMEGARFCFFLTLAFSAGVSLLAFAPAASREEGRLQTATAAVAAVALALGSYGLYKACLRTNASWVHAGKEVQAVLKSAINLATNSGADQRLLVLGIPKKNAGAHLIYNGATFRTGLQPPFSSSDFSRKFITFDPIFYGPSQYMNSARFKQNIKDKHVSGPIVWNSEKLSFVLAPLPSVADDQRTEPILLSAPASTGTNRQFHNLKLNPLACDYLTFEYAVPAACSSTSAKFQITWKGTECADSRPQLCYAEKIVPLTPGWHGTVRVPLSHHWHWFTCGLIDDVEVSAPGIDGATIANVRLCSGDSVRPTLAATAADDSSGVFAINSNTKFAADARAVPLCAKLLVESSKPNYFYDQIDDGQQSDSVYKSVVIDAPAFSGALPQGFAPGKTYSEIRCRALDAAGKPVGEYSEPIIVFSNQ